MNLFNIGKMHKHLQVNEHTDLKPSRTGLTSRSSPRAIGTQDSTISTENILNAGRKRPIRLASARSKGTKNGKDTTSTQRETQVENSTGPPDSTDANLTEALKN